MDDYALSFDAKVLAFESPFIGFTTADLTFDIEGYTFGMTLIDDIPALVLRKPDLDFDLSLNLDMLAALEFKDIDLSLSPDLLIDFDYNQQFGFYANYNFMKLNLDDFNIKVGFDTLIFFDYNPCDFMVLFKDPGTIPNFEPGVYSICDEYLLSANMGGALFSQGISQPKRTFQITPDLDFVYNEYEKDRFKAKLSFPLDYQYKISYYRPDDKYGGGIGKLYSGDIHAELSTPEVNLIGVRTNDAGKIEGFMKENFAYDLNRIPAELVTSDFDAYCLYSDSKILVDGEYLKHLKMETPEKGELLEGSPEIAVEGPRYIGTIADKAGGLLRGTFGLWVNPNEVVMTGTLNADKFVTVKGAFEFKASPQTWSLKMGSEEQPITLGTPTYTFKGHLWINPNSLGVGFKAGGNVSAGLDIDVVKVSVNAGYETRGAFSANLDPFAFQRLKLGASAYFNVYCQLCEPTGIGDALGVGSCATLTVGGNFSGDVEANFGDKELNGKFSGSVNAFGINVGPFDVNGKLKL